ncbi:hypothetical protein M9Y10_007145 [Tritrichomonas musculus]|uniref:non-specific serine/threonine protein kinase n=1 Tax=Tritrichomonas musculus TaxID=1915356 RepID=A0ABR2J0T1_9EUKA
MSKKTMFDFKTKSSDFKVIQLLGCGAFGQVFELLHIPSGKHYAGKLFIDVDSAKLKEINKEIGIMDSMDSEYMVNFYGMIKFPKTNPHSMIIMDYCDRGSVRDIMDYNEITLTEEQMSFILHDLLCALSVLHNKYKIIHRDIKLANILMSTDSSVKVTDFGISRKFEQTTIHTSSTVGTPYWMAPEVILSEKYSYPADIWSVGATAVELAEGAPPFCELPETRAMNEIVTRGFPGFRSGTTISSELRNFIYKCMIRNPDRRPTADELLTHPFIRKCEKLDRKATFANVLSQNINFVDLIADEDIEYITKFIKFENTPEYNKQTNKSESKKTFNTFIKKAAPGVAVDSIYVKDANSEQK